MAVSQRRRTRRSLRKPKASWLIGRVFLSLLRGLIKSVTSALLIYVMQSTKLPSEVCNNLEKINRDFLWGNTSDTKKIHLVNWDTVCLPKQLGGLGTKKMNMMNQALLAKAGWRLSQKVTGLWGNLLKDKYLRGGHMTVYDSLKDMNCSSTWRGLSYGAKLLFEGVHWRVGDGCRISFWTDIWILELGKLLRHASCPLFDNQSNEKVSDYLTANEWNLRKLSSILPWHIVHRIFSIHIGSIHDAEDTVICGLSKTGDFSVNSAYKTHFNNSEADSWKWKFIWKLKLPPRVLYFIWILLHGKLLTNVNRAIRGFTLDSTRVRCKEGCEDLEHVFRGCNVSRGIWEVICKGVTMNTSFKVDWHEWLFTNLMCSKLCLGRIPGYLFFAVTLWFIWKWRCDRVFDSVFQLPRCPGKIIWNYADEWLAANTDMDKVVGMKSYLICWTPPPLDWLKLNVDGISIPDTSSISAGGVIRDSNKRWLIGFALNKCSCIVIEAELWGIFEDLKLAWNAGFRKVMVESDSQTAVLLLSNIIPLNHPLFNIIRACKSILENEWSCNLHHNYRESNRVADFLANLGHALDLKLTVFEEPPTQISSILEDDCKGDAVARMIPSS
ncbi:hypothetical protein Dsin_002966 [Dipteronia sinensis]|uniref:RNase H type-1 domain-containing protein n=1 Tax=Dipteronia sinensis TaxID=43782 RepID=A0AAE0ELR1_9ROSI|nr:hypothetical protein Dsin_002966 [Dipteronia sinensis]